MSTAVTHSPAHQAPPDRLRKAAIWSWRRRCGVYPMREIRSFQRESLRSSELLRKDKRRKP